MARMKRRLTFLARGSRNAHRGSGITSPRKRSLHRWKERRLRRFGDTAISLGVIRGIELRAYVGRMHLRTI
jgi:hypothetical protein